MPDHQLEIKVPGYYLCFRSIEEVVECAFGRLKGRWRCLLKRLDNDVQSVSGIVSACSTLHNVCEVHGDCFDDQWVEGVEEGNMREN
jgi:hypothetical protein